MNFNFDQLSVIAGLVLTFLGSVFLKDKYSKKDDNRLTLEGINKALHQSNDRLTARLDRLEEKNKSLREENERLEEENDYYKSEVKKLEYRVNRLEYDLKVERGEA